MTLEQPIDSRLVGEIYDEQAELFTGFALASYSWEFIEKPAFDHCISDLYVSSAQVLDIGCGSGRVVDHLISKGILRQNIVGIDASSKLIEIAKRRIAGVKFIQCLIDEMELPSESFDLVTSNMVFHYIDNETLERSLDRIYEVLKPNGELFFVDSEPDQDKPKKGTNNSNAWLVEKTPWGTEVPYFNRAPHDLLQKILYFGGFDIVTILPLEIIDEGKVDIAQFLHYSANFSRIAVRMQKVSKEEKLGRLKSKNRGIASL